MKKQKKSGLWCLQCGRRLIVHQDWRVVYLSCRFCGGKFPIEHFSDFMDAELEEGLGNIPCDRI